MQILNLYVLGGNILIFWHGIGFATICAINDKVLHKQNMYQWYPRCQRRLHKTFGYDDENYIKAGQKDDLSK